MAISKKKQSSKTDATYRDLNPEFNRENEFNGGHSYGSIFRWNKYLISLSIVALVLLGCATTDPGNSAGITYALPRTDAEVKLSVTLKDCTPDKATFNTDVSLISVVSAQKTKYHISGDQLRSSKIKRGLTITVDKHGVITSINSSNSDRTPMIIGNVLKTVATILPVLLVDGPTTTLCNPEVQQALVTAKELAKSIKSKRDNLNEFPLPAPQEMKSLIEKINILATELARLNTGILRVDTVGKITLERANFNPRTPNIVGLDEKPFEKWFRSNAKFDISKNFEITWTVQAPTPEPAPIFVEVDPKKRKNGRTQRECGFYIDLPAPSEATISLSLFGDAFTKKIGPVETFYAAQIEPPATLCLDVGFGEDRTVALNFDSFGRTTSFGWNSEATGEVISGAVVGYASSLTGIAASLGGPSTLDDQKQEIDRLNTQLTLNQLRKCKAIIDAGGFTCPEK